MITAKEITEKLIEQGNEDKKIILQRFFKTGKGQYGEGDIFLGITVPQTREVIKYNNDISLDEIDKLIQSKYHECRLAAVLLLIVLFKKAKKDTIKQEEIFNFYITHHKHINNWDIVDLSAPHIIGEYLIDKDKSILSHYAQSENLWLQRIAIVSTLCFIRNNHFDTTLTLSKILLNHPHDLIQKAVGWMLREIGKRDFETEQIFLLENSRYKQMPRTMLRYAIEKFPENIRLQYLKGLI